MRVVAVLMLLALTALAGCSGKEMQGDQLRLSDGTTLELDGTGTSDVLGAIAGVVVDDAIRPIVGAIVATTDGRNASTDASGVFRIGDLEPGLYILNVNALGYTPIQAAADVVAGETATVKVLMPRDLRPQPYHLTYMHEGYMQVWAGIGQFFVEILLDEGSGLCNCRLEVQPDPNATDFIVEAFWDHAVADPLNLAEFYLSFEEVAPDGFLETGYCYSPCRFAFSADGVGYLGGAVLARLDGADAWVTYQQQFKLYVTVFHNGDAPEGWSIASQPA